ncbi:MAG TPA: HprK-related kinase A [Rhodocyclaceae bacterium]|nr:HprK-related kinase A [Rhodocyclaceae bacterium]HRQ45548.1 HprK-related kinase A [Rhodocyclaceae bacterium]
MKVADVSPREFDAQLAGEGVCLDCGPYVVRITSSVREVATGLRFHYADFPLHESRGFVDFAIVVRHTSLLRRFLRPQVNFYCDGKIPFKPVPASQAFPMLEWGLNWVISTHAHDHLVLHGAVLEREGRALILAADPGSGKSTLCAGLVDAGWRLLSDELTLIDLDCGRIRAIARPVSLKNESINVVRDFGAHTQVGEICVGTTKGVVAHMRPPLESVERRGESADPAWIVFPGFTRDGRLSVQRVGKAAAFMELTRHAFNYAPLSESAFEALVRVTDACDIYRIAYGGLDEVVPLLDRMSRSAEPIA